VDHLGLVRIAEFTGRVTDRRSTIVLAAMIITVAFGFFDYFLDSAMLEIGVDPRLHSAAQATFVGLGAGAAAFVLLLARRERRKLIQDQVFKVAELNHRLRNGLQVIVDSHHAPNDEVQQRMIFDTVASINDTLRQLFPTLGIERRQESRSKVIQLPQRGPERRTS
jgi:hypothetical protein